MTSQNSADAGAPIADVPAPDAPVPGAPASAVVPADQANPAFAAPASAASAAGHPTQAGQRRRRVVHLGPKDRERVAEGANLEQVVQEALGKVDAERPAWSREDLRREDPSAHANDARLLGDVPPHYGNGV